MDLFGKPDKVGLTQAEFGRRIGVSQQRVGQLIKLGMPVLAGGKIDAEAGAAWVSENLDVERRARGRSGVRGTDGSSSLAEARRVHEVVKTERAKLKLQTEAGELIPRSAAAAAAFTWGRAVRDAWTGWASRIAPALAAESGADLAALAASLDRSVRQHLEDLADLPPPEQFHA